VTGWAAVRPRRRRAPAPAVNGSPCAGRAGSGRRAGSGLINGTISGSRHHV